MALSGLVHGLLYGFTMFYEKNASSNTQNAEITFVEKMYYILAVLCILLTYIHYIHIYIYTYACPHR